MIGVELGDSGKLGRIRLTRVGDKSAASIMPALEAMVEPGSTVHTDGWTSYNGLEQAGYHHTVSVIAGSKERAIEELPHVHLVASLLRRFLLGTYQGAAKIWHLQQYLEEFVFRFNRRRSRFVGKIFMRLAQGAVVTEPAPYRAIIARC